MLTDCYEKNQSGVENQYTTIAAGPEWLAYLPKIGHVNRFQPLVYYEKK